MYFYTKYKVKTMQNVCRQMCNCEFVMPNKDKTLFSSSHITTICKLFEFLNIIIKIIWILCPYKRDITGKH